MRTERQGRSGKGQQLGSKPQWKAQFVAARLGLPDGPDYFAFDLRGQRCLAWAYCQCGKPYALRFSDLRKRKNSSLSLRFCEECRRKYREEGREKKRLDGLKHWG